jgi:hypothetical protein
VGEEARQDCDEFGQDLPLVLLARAEIDRGAQVQQEPGGDLAVLVVDSNVRHLRARRHVPVDMADVVVHLIFAKVSEIEADAAEQGAIVPLQQSVEPADHRPFEPR